MKDYAPRIRLSKAEHDSILKLRQVNNVLVIGDIHEPFCLEGYLDFCLEQYNRFNCNKVVFIGDVIDNHYSSFHGTDPNGYGGGYELKKAIEGLKKWHDAFPNAYVTIGNHDRIIYRKAFAAGVPKEWIVEYKDVLKTPTWKYVDHIEIDDILYIHGEGGTARTAMRNHNKSVVQGHLHTQKYIEWNNENFGMQVGCGIDDSAYAFAYAKYGKKSALGCAVVLDNGKLPINIVM